MLKRSTLLAIFTIVTLLTASSCRTTTAVKSKENFLAPRLDKTIERLKIHKSNKGLRPVDVKICLQLIDTLSSYKQFDLSRPIKGSIKFAGQIHLYPGQSDSVRAKVVNCQNGIKGFVPGHRCHAIFAEGFSVDDGLPVTAEGMAQSDYNDHYRRWVEMHPGEPDTIDVQKYLKYWIKEQQEGLYWYWSAIDAHMPVYGKDHRVFMYCYVDLVKKKEYRGLAESIKMDHFIGTLLAAYQHALNGDDVVIIWGNDHEADYRYFMEQIHATPEVIVICEDCQFKDKS